jgi:hypothetical protein
VFLQYGRDLLIDVTEAHREIFKEQECVRLCGPIAYPDCTPHDVADNSRHLPVTRLKVVADRNDPPARSNPGINDDSGRVIRQWSDGTATVWELDDIYEPLGHGGRLLGTVTIRPGGSWAWKAAFADAAGETDGDYLTAESALIAATLYTGWRFPRTGSQAKDAAWRMIYRASKDRLG